MHTQTDFHQAIEALEKRRIDATFKVEFWNIETGKRFLSVEVSDHEGGHGVRKVFPDLPPIEEAVTEVIDTYIELLERGYSV